MGIKFIPFFSFYVPCMYADFSCIFLLPRVVFNKRQSVKSLLRAENERGPREICNVEVAHNGKKLVFLLIDICGAHG